MAPTNSVLLALALVLTIFAQLSSQSDIPFPQSVINEMATREMRYHHYLFHNLRDRWNKLSEESQKQIADLGWAPPRPSRSYDCGKQVQILDNDSGQDFLYMHRQMVERVNKIITENNEPYGNITGWKTIPAPDCEQYPVPPTYTIPCEPVTTSGTAIRKSDSFYDHTIQPLEATFMDPEELRKMTLGQLGARIESTMHAYLHMRWSNESSYGFRPSRNEALPNFDAKWDDPEYDWLGDPYAAHVNPIFWKIHGWIDDRVEDWKQAHNLTTIQWNATWTGGPMSSLSSVLDMHEMHMESSTKTAMRVPVEAMGNSSLDAKNGSSMSGTMEKVMGIVLSEVSESGFVEDVVVDDFVPEAKKSRQNKSKEN